jgi:tetratricopeptide (TPR) repeat protein
MGEVYAAYDPRLDRRVALKLIRPETAASDERARDRLLREAQITARLSHPNVIGVHDAGKFDEHVFIAMEFVEGQTLAEWINERTRTWQEVLAIFIQAARGLAAAHAAGLVHRDFKPQNVMVATDGTVRVMDFGLARRVDQASTQAVAPGVATRAELSLTRTGQFLGTPAYMAPEQFAGNVTSARADQFSFCVSLYEGLYSQRPFEGATFAELRANVLAGVILAPPSDTKVPKWLHRTVLRGLERSPSARYETAYALIAALSHDPARVRRRWIAAVAGLALTSMVGTAGAIGWRASHQGANLCARGADKLAGVWEGSGVPDSARKRAIRRVFSDTGVSYAPTTFARVQQILDRYVDTWAQSYRQTCEATHVRGEQSAEALDLRMSCLSDRLARLRELTGVFANATTTVVENAVNAASALPGLERCDDLKLLRSITPVPDDPAARERLEALRESVARVRVLGDSGRCGEAATMGRKVANEAKTIGYGPLEAEALAALGQSAPRCMSANDTIAILQEAILAATASHDDEAAVEAMVLLAHIHADRTGDVVQGRVWIDLAGALLRGMRGNHSALEMWLQQTSGRMAAKEGHPEEALKLLQRAQALAQRTHPEYVGTVVSNVGIIFQEMNRPTEALERYHEAAEIDANVFGPEHPAVAMDLTDEGEVLNSLHREEEARPLLLRALEIWRRSSAHPFYTAWTLTRLGESLLGLGRPTEARAPLEEAVRLTPSDKDQMRIASRFMLAHALWVSSEERPRAVRLAQEAVASAAELPSRSPLASSPEAIRAWLRDHPPRSH